MKNDPIKTISVLRPKDKNTEFVVFWIKDIKNKVPKAIIIPGKAYPAPAAVDKKLMPLKL